MSAIISEISVSGFGVFLERTALKFEPGRTIILGVNDDSSAADSNGAGKTTLFKALSWGLYGETIDRLSEPDVLHKKAEKAIVQVWFSANGRFYRVTRARTAKTGKLELHEVGEPGTSRVIADRSMTSKKATQDEIIKLLGLDWDAFRCTCLFGQGDHSRFASPSMTDAARKSVLSTILRLDVYDEAREKARELRTEADRLVVAMSEEISTIDRKIDAENRKVDASNARIEVETALLSSGESAVRSIDVVLAEWKAERVKIQNWISKKKEELSKINENKDGAVEDLNAAKGLKTERARAHREAVEKASELSTEGECPSCGQARPYDPGKHRKAISAVDVAERRLRKADDLLREIQREVSEISGAAREAEDSLRTKDTELRKLDGRIATEEGRKAATVTAMREADGRLLSARKDADVHKANIEELLESRYAPEKELDRQTKRRSLADWWVNGLGPKGVPAYAIEQSLPVLNQKANRHLVELADGDIEVSWTATTTGSSGVEKEELTQNLIIEGISGAAPSGGQSKKIELATELALAEMMQEREGVGTNLLLLDEALDGLDRQGQERVVEWVHSCLPHETVFVISHDESIAESFDSRITITKSGGASTLTKEG